MADMFAISVNVEDGMQQSEAVSSSLHPNDGGDPGAVDKLTEQTEISIVRLDDSAIPRQLCRSNMACAGSAGASQKPVSPKGGMHAPYRHGRRRG